MARKRIVYHGTTNEALDPKNLNPEQSLHVGTEKAAMDRLRNTGSNKGVVHQFEITTRPAPMVWADPSLESDESHERMKQGKRWWQAVESNREGDVSRPVRYINEWEDPGSMSFVVMPHHLKHLSSQFIDFSE